MVTDIQGRILNVKYIESIGEIKKEVVFKGFYDYEETGKYEFYVYMTSGDSYKFVAETKEYCVSKREEVIALMLAEAR